MAVFISTFLDGALFRNIMFPEFDYRAAIRYMRDVVLDHLREGTQLATRVPRRSAPRRKPKNLTVAPDPES
jgi:hypothetical protein